jgi:hypothetical protein
MKFSLPVDQTLFEIKRAASFQRRARQDGLAVSQCSLHARSKTDRSPGARPQLRLFDSAPGYPADEPIEKEIVRDRHRDAGN